MAPVGAGSRLSSKEAVVRHICKSCLGCDSSEGVMMQILFLGTRIRQTEDYVVKELFD